MTSEKRCACSRRPGALPPVGATVTASLDWDNRYRTMRAHTLMHLLCASVPFPVTGGAIGEDGGRIDFDIPEGQIPDKADLSTRINRLVEEDHAVSFRWITDEEMAANQHLIRTMSVKPPMGHGPCAPRHDWRRWQGRSAALRRHASEIHRRHRPHCRDKDREQGQDQPPHPHRIRLRPA
jgi:hypothetical protein